MILINAIQSLFVALLIYLVVYLADHQWYSWLFLLEVGAVVFVISVVSDLIIDRVIKWFNKDHLTFKGY